MSQARFLMILLNGPLGIGKSTLGEVLGEAIDRSVTLDGDALSALNPAPVDELASMHDVVALLVAHHLTKGFKRFVLNHYWPSRSALRDLEDRLLAIDPTLEVHCFRLELEREENLKRITLRQGARAIDESEFEARNFAKEHVLLSAAGDSLGEPFDVSDPPDILAARIMKRIGLSPSTQ